MREDHFKPLDGLRGVAILLVILVHSFSYKGASVVGRGLETFARTGWTGVTLFFVLSGFLITGILLDTRGRQHYLRDFFARRSLRIFPLYFAFLAVYFFVVPHVRGASALLPQPPPDMRIYYWTYTANMMEWLAGARTSVAPLEPLWSLSVEEQVYLFWPFVILLVPARWRIKVFVGLALSSFAWRFLGRLNALSVESSYGWAPANLEAFAAGAMVALFSREHADRLRSWAPRMAMASALFVGGMLAGQQHFNFWDAPVQMLTVGTSGLVWLFASTIGISVTSSDRLFLNKVLSVTWLRLVGKYSYAIYLFHGSVILLLSSVFSQRTGIVRGEDVLAGLVFSAGVAVCSFLAACVSWYVWESQFLRLKKYFPLSGSVIRIGGPMRISHSSCFFLACLFSAALTVAACGSPQPRESQTPAPSGDAAFNDIARLYLEDLYKRQPTQATFLGIHKYDDQLEPYTRQAAMDGVASAKAFRERVAAIDSTTLSASTQLDREQLLHAIDSRVLNLDVVRPWARDPDSYPSGIANTAYVMIKRRFAPPDERLRLLIARERAMPAALAEAKKNVENPPRVYTEIAIEQVDGNRGFFETAVAAAFPEVTDQALLAEFRQANGAVIAALREYKQWLQSDLLKRSNGDFAIGEDTYRKKLSADEMIELPLGDLLAMAERDLRKNQAAFVETARLIDPKRTPMQVLEAAEADHPPAAKLLSVTQGELDALGRFMSDRRIVTIPQAAPARVEETPPFLRATTTASMDIPGPFETVATEAYYNMTLPDPKASAASTREFMKQWYYPAISNVSVHEVWPGHYLQFLYARRFPSDVRKVFGAASNSEGWAHYCEQMVIDEGFHADDPRYRLAQIQDALLRDVRFIAGIRMHTQGMTIAQAEELFVKEGYQPRPVARSESKRGTSDATYGYYTMGKLMILKLRDDYKAKLGARYSLLDFHDTFIGLGPLPLPLVRKAMLGEVGELF